MAILSEKNSVLVVVDVQEKLARVMHDREQLIVTLVTLICGMQALKVPILWLEQNPSRMGETVPEIRNLLMAQQSAIGKMSFSGYGDPVFIENLEAIGCRQVLLSGIETHVCVYQTAVDLLQRGFEVSVVADAVSSRKVTDRDIALIRMRDEGVKICSAEMVLFELMRSAAHPAFKDVLKIVR